MTMTGATARPLRADAVRNRARILAAAQEVFAERGLDVTLDDIAHHAGLGVGTVYRRFVDRESLVEALFDERMQASIVALQIALQAPDPLRALVEAIRGHCEEFAGDRGLRQVMFSSGYGREELARCREEIPMVLEQLVDKAKESNRLRADFEASDIPMLFLMLGAVIDFSGPVQPDLWRRYLDVFLDGMQAHPPCPDGGIDFDPLVPALRHDELMAAMDNWHPATPR